MSDSDRSMPNHAVQSLDPGVVDLAKRIRDSVDQPETVDTQLASNQQIISRITDGIYREPWAAFRELVANAYDADATHVVIETGAPDFDQITVRDNGLGMSAETVSYIIQNIGASSKRRTLGAELHTVQPGAVELSPGGRPLIGKIGIGLFAVAQLTQHFQIITKSRDDPVRISATVRMRTHNDADEHYVAGEVIIKSGSVPEADKGTHGTTVVLYTLRPEVRRTLQSARRWEAALSQDVPTESRQAPPSYHIGRPARQGSNGDLHRKPRLPWQLSDSPEKKFTTLVDAAADITGRTSKPADLDHFDEYLKLVWKLSLSLPLDYPDGHPFDRQGQDGLLFLTIPSEGRQAQPINLDRHETLRSNLGLASGDREHLPTFDVTLDSVALRRPLRHAASLGAKSRIPAPILFAAKQDDPFPSEDHDRAGGPLSFEAYLYWNSRIKPKDTAGVLVRIREASGTLFDPTFLNYQVSELTRLRQISAEILVTQGLDGAINIDRESFNYSHPHFLYLQRWLHRSLRLLVNRLKGIAKEDLDHEKATKRIKAETTLRSRAEDIWQRRLGDEADPPLAAANGVLPDEVGGTEIDWSPSDRLQAAPARTSLSIILEAYGVLSSLPGSDRAHLIRDILSVFGPRT